MPLAGYQPPVKEVTLGDSVVQFSGLSLNDVSVLVQTNLNDAEKLFELFDQSIGDGKHLHPEKLTNLAVSLANHAPKFTSAVIALAAVEETDFAARLAAAAKMPAPLQIELLMDIGHLTFEEAGGVKKFLDRLAGLMGNLNIQRPVLTKASQIAA